MKVQGQFHTSPRRRYHSPTLAYSVAERIIRDMSDYFEGAGALPRYGGRHGRAHHRTGRIERWRKAIGTAPPAEVLTAVHVDRS